MKFAHTVLVAALFGAGLMASTGCTTAQRTRMNMTNAADSTASSDEQDYNDYARVVDNNTRGVWDDLARLMLIDKSSRLSPYVVP